MFSQESIFPPIREAGGNTSTKNGDTLVDSVESRYRLHTAQEAGTCDGKPIEVRFVPYLHQVLDGKSETVNPVYGAAFPGTWFGCPRYVQFLDTIPGKEWYYQVETRWCFSSPGHCERRRVVSTDTSLTIGGNNFDSLLLIEQFSIHHGPIHEYYRRGVGMVYRVETDSNGASTKSRLLIAHHVNRAAKLSQVIRIQSLSPNLTGIPTASWGKRGEGRYGFIFGKTGPGEDTLSISASASSGLPVSVSIVEGEGKALGAGKLVYANDFGASLVRISEAGDAAYHPAVFEGPVCVSPYPVIKVDSTEAGTFLESNLADSIFWEKDGEDIPATGQKRIKVAGPGRYRLIAKYTYPDNMCGSALLYPSKPIEIAAPDPVSTGLAMRLFGKHLWGRLPLGHIGAANIQVRDLQGKSVPDVTARIAGSTFIAETEETLRPGIYSYRACISPECLSGLVILP